MDFFKKYRFAFILFFLIISCRDKTEKSQKLLFWCSNNNQEIQLCTAIKDKWNLNHPANTVHMQPIPEGQSSEEVILAAVVGKSAPDIYANMWQGNVEMYAHAGVLIPLDTLKGFLDFIKERCDSNVIKEITSSDGHIYQVPWKVNPIMTIYNKNLFAENNIHDLPKTYNAYFEAAQAFKDKNSNSEIPKRFGYTAVKPIWYEMRFNFYPLYLAASDGAHLIQNNKAVFNNKYAVGVFRFLQNLYNKNYFSRENAAASSDPFIAQTIATKWTGPWEIAHLNSIPNLGFKYDYYEEIVPDNHTGPVYTYGDAKNIVMFNTCTNPHVAWEFIKTLIDEEGDLQLLKLTGQFPRRKNLSTDLYFSSFLRANPMLSPFVKQLPFLKGDDNCEVIVEVLDIISQEYEACVVYGKKTPEKAIADAEAAVNVLLGKGN
ncbi:MAG: extracellular solute-binding protein [Bacteroidota bacterium]|nr:extracellular solute-binding protein [Bacteroidota bacterium]